MALGKILAGIIRFSSAAFNLFFFRVGLKTQPESKCPELLANYCDMLLRKTPLSKKLTSEEIEAKLKEVVYIYIFFLISAVLITHFEFVLCL